MSGEVVSRTKNTLNTVWQFRVALRTHTFTHWTCPTRFPAADTTWRTHTHTHTHTERSHNVDAGQHQHAKYMTPVITVAKHTR